MEADAYISDTIEVKPRTSKRSNSPATTTSEPKFDRNAVIMDSDSEGEEIVVAATATNGDRALVFPIIDANESDSDVSELALTPSPPNSPGRDVDNGNTTVATVSVGENTTHAPVTYESSSSSSSSDSHDLSSPPTTAQIPPPNLASHHVDELNCVHTDACDCPAHAGYEQNARFVQFSEYSLSAMQHPESNLRSTLDQRVLAKQTATNESMINLLVAMAHGTISLHTARRRARAFEGLLNIYFPSNRVSPGEKTVAEQVVYAWELLKIDQEWGKFTERVEAAVGGHPVVMREFREFLPDFEDPDIVRM